MKKKIIYISFFIGVIALLIFSFNLKPKQVEASWCSFGYKNTKTWPGNCINCFCDQWTHIGDAGCPHDPPEGLQ